MNKLSVIIVNYKGWNALEECLDSLEDIHSEENSLEVKPCFLSCLGITHLVAIESFSSMV